MKATYHNHSRWSDGKARVEDIIASAASQGIDELGISDHWVLHPDGEVKAWAMPTERLDDYVAELGARRRELAKSGGLKLRIGLEVDWFVGHAEHISRALAPHAFDYVIGSCHELDVPGFPGNQFIIDMSPESWRMITSEHRDAMHRQYWVTMKSMALSGLFDIVAHIDLPKKFGYLPTIDLSAEIDDALDAIASTRNSTGGPLVVELNTSGWHKPCADAYPSEDIVRRCVRRGIPMTLSADAHQPEHLLRDFDRGAKRLIDAGCAGLARFASREAWHEPF